MKVINITPMGKPRMVKSDAWKKRDCVLKYWEYKDKLVEEAKKLDYSLPYKLENITFVFPMPKSWKKDKKLEMLTQPHLQKPDLDNIIKAFQDCLSKDDSRVWCFNNIQKRWGIEGQIIFHSL